jgi:class 3 adenylate cyclase
VARQNIERRLAAILSADVAGYSRLMEVDEAGTLAALQAHRAELIDPTIAAHHGRIVKLMGDGLLVEFASAIDAVECAVEIQQGMAVRNASVPDGRRIALRVGVNLGDVIIEDDDIYGDGVNVAARLQELAERGGVYISGTVFEQVDGKIDQQFSDMGNQQIKNIAKPVRVYRARLMDISAAGKHRPFFSTSSAEASPVTGGCLCGAVRYEISAPAIDVAYCHCRMCQRFTGGQIVAGAFFPAEAIRFTQGDLKYYQSSPIAERGFCANCGSSVIYRSLAKQKFSDANWVLLASLDKPENFVPSWHLGIESQMPWLEVHDDLPRVRCKDSPSIAASWKSVGLPVPEPNLR